MISQVNSLARDKEYNLNNSFHPIFLPYLFARQSIQIFVGTAGSGKSEFNYQRGVLFALKKKYFRLLYCRKVAGTLRDSVFLGFKDVIKEWKLTDEFIIKESEMDIISRRTGNMLLSFGLDDPEKLKSVKDPTHVMIEEFPEVSFDDYAQLQLRLRTDKTDNLQLWAMMNPIYGTWIREYFFLDSENDEIPLGEVPARTNDTLILKTTYKDNPFINVAQYEQKILELAHGDQNKLIVYGEGNWGAVQTGNEFYHFNKSLHVNKVEFINGKAVHITLDFNVQPYLSLLAAQVDITASHFEIRFFREYCMHSPLNSTEAACRKFLEDYEGKFSDLLVYGDASGNSRIAGKGNVTAFDDVKKTLHKYLSSASMRVMKTNPPVMKSRDFINDILAGKVYYNGLLVKIIFDEKMTETIKDFMTVKLGAEGKVKKRVNDKLTGISYELGTHTSDAASYLIIRLLYDIFKK